MSDWNFDISQAPKTMVVTRRIGRNLVTREEPARLIIALDDGQVGTSRWLGKRWEGMTEGQKPLAWIAWPTHPQASE